ncbi:hypothetical protein Metev_2305 (plasmid) [Methanohalobium evestigatum Z-7303]|uniref:Uncharacterized protein n=1 Tax=Methanohalobium evestigatum (strain ATCC BAA-1072 / DSM 3721 / NBRC 107634 / OCM 161 / Z-7303) TaxID=644295 RepID=D7EBZ5_METEZ|nr:hypothetical protein [Methanohalobium evestigatum]ADI75117.1 hypothetical protein Metev_2305 [Methanohalobium evestigatum Z-7303]
MTHYQRISGPNENFSKWNVACDFNNRNQDKTDIARSCKYINSITKKLERVTYAFEVLKLLPAEPLIKVISKRYLYDHYGNHVNLSLKQRENVRLALINSKIVNWYPMKLVTPNKTINSTPFFLNELGKYYYYNVFGFSPESVSLKFYRDKVVKNRLFSVEQLNILSKHYDNLGYDTKTGLYPFDLIVDDLHGFLLIDQHENTIGIEKRISEAIHQSRTRGILLYFPAMTPEMQRRISAVVAGILYNENRDKKYRPFSYVTYIESAICSGKNTFDWSYYITAPKNYQRAHIPETLSFPKTDIRENDFVSSSMRVLRNNKSYQQKVKQNFNIQYISGLNGKEIVPNIKVSVGIGQILSLWEELANNSEVILTGLCSNQILDSIGSYPRLLIVDGARNGADHLNTLDKFRKNGAQVLELHRNHAKAVLTDDKFLIHSMTTSKYAGNNIDSFAVIDFGEHKDRKLIKEKIYKLLYYFAMEQNENFKTELEDLRKIFQYKIELYPHFNCKVKDWDYFKRLSYLSRVSNSKLIIFSSHLSMKKLAKNCKFLVVQGTSRSDNHDCYMTAIKHGYAVIKRRLWHPRLIFNNEFVSTGSWDFSPIREQKELQMIIHTS